jgi:hypothetical protein
MARMGIDPMPPRLLSPFVHDVMLPIVCTPQGRFRRIPQKSMPSTPYSRRKPAGDEERRKTVKTPKTATVSVALASAALVLAPTAADPAGSRPLLDLVGQAVRCRLGRANLRLHPCGRPTKTQRPSGALEHRRKPREWSLHDGRRRARWCALHRVLPAFARYIFVGCGDAGRFGGLDVRRRLRRCTGRDGKLPVFTGALLEHTGFVIPDHAVRCNI